MKLRLAIAVAAVFTLVVGVMIGTATAATLFSDNFEDGNTTGWSKSGGEWSVVSDGSRVLQQSKLDSELARMFAGSSSWSNYTVEARVKPTAFDGSGRFAGIAARSAGSTTMYRLVLLNSNRAELQMHNGGTVVVIGGANLTVSTGSWYALRITVSGSTISGYVNGNQIASGTNSQYGQGRIALLTFHATARFDDVLVTDSTTPPPPTPTPSTSTSPPPPPPPGNVIGWGAGTTGGGNATPVTVTSASALLSAMQSSSPAVIRVQGTITLSGMNDVASNKTILGVGSNATITGGGLDIDGATNVIVRNINFTNWDDDGINVQYSTRVWLDHNNFSNGYDGALDIKRASDLITVSWNRFFNHDKTCLLGHSDGNASEDRGRLRVTYHHNWFDGSVQRNPRVRFGNPVHVFNNYYVNNSGYGVASTQEGGVRVEGNYFENVEDPFHLGEGSSPAGTLVAMNNFFVNSGSGQTGGSVNSIPYSYSVDTPSAVKSIVTAGAGTGKI